MAVTKKILENINAKYNIDTNIQIKMPKSKQTIEKKYKCLCCGASWDTQKSHFSRTSSLLYQANDGFVPICNSCRDVYYRQLVDLYRGNEAHAVKHICTIFDIIFHDEAFASSRATGSDKTCISSYLIKRGLTQTVKVGTTYTDGLKYDYTNKKLLEESEEESSITKVALDRWGVGIFNDNDYNVLEEHYKMLKKANPNCDSNQEIFIKSLCHLNLLMMNALKSGDLDGYTKANSEYGKTFTKAGLKTVQDTDKNADDCWGIFMEQISQYTPEEYYKDKKMYEDASGIGKQFERFVLRPLKNILLKTSERDEEYNVEGVSDE